jgi:hypothetical protein
MALITSLEIYDALPVPDDALDKGGVEMLRAGVARKSAKRQPAESVRPIKARAKSKPSSKPIARRNNARAKS